MLTAIVLSAVASVQTPAAPKPAATRDETILVTAALEPVPLRNAGREVTLIGREEIDRLPARSIADVLRVASSVEVRARGAFGVQADFQIRGASFGQALVLIDGVRINDAQSGHHNADFPVGLDEVERIEILRGPGSSLHGADAFGGIIQVITRPIGGLRGEASAGSFGAASARIGAGGKAGERTLSLSAAVSHTEGFMPDRDADEALARVRVGLDEKSTFTLGHLDKEFGANGFYGPAPSREWTEQTMATLSRELGARAATAGVATAFYRTHRDRFVYDRRNPALSDNRHRTHAFGLGLRGSRPMNDRVRVSAGVDGGSDRVTSSNLGDHSYTRGSVFAEAQWVSGRTILYPGLRFDVYETFGSSLSPGLALARTFGSSTTLRASVGHAFRVPTYTELYYRDPNHQARNDLEPEEAWSGETGVEWSAPSGLSVGAALFSRWDDSVIDWVKATAQERWHTENLRDVTTRGVELSVRRPLGRSGRASVSYTGLRVLSSVPAAFSKYVLDYARRSFAVAVSGDLAANFNGGVSASYKLRQDSRSYWVVDLRAARRVGRAEVFVDGQNLLDTRYQEIRGVDLPGRSFSAGVRLNSR